ncbi:hypothetical protein [Rhodoligotrophos defluvii]|uniref:hypothetical protein n=1 Tax=Rhodoligotrophos defluvii TaxID=2561934 RepID=UPI0014854C6B|nr:hypothetical protein [Rhodoligotrophos defluvii]
MWNQTGPPLIKDTTIWAGIASAVSILTGILGALDNRWALAAFALVFGFNDRLLALFPSAASLI